MTRYRIAVGPYWLAAIYDDSSSGVKLTRQAEDACSWSTQEAAATALRQVSETFMKDARLQVVEEPDYPSSWGAKTQGAMPVEVV